MLKTASVHQKQPLARVATSFALLFAGSRFKDSITSYSKLNECARRFNYLATAFLLHVFVQSKIRNVSGTFLLVKAVLAFVGKTMIVLGLLPPETESEANAC